MPVPMSFAEIARVEGISERAAENIVFRAMKKLTRDMSHPALRSHPLIHGMREAAAQISRCREFNPYAGEGEEFVGQN